MEEKKRKGEKGQFLLGFCYALTLLEGFPNWINKCLIPISWLDLSAQTEEAVSYGRDEEKEWEVEKERERLNSAIQDRVQEIGKDTEIRT